MEKNDEKIPEELEISLKTGVYKAFEQQGLIQGEELMILLGAEP